VIPRIAFQHDIAFSGGFQGAADADRRAIATLGEALAGSDRPFVIGLRDARGRTGASRYRTGRARSRPGCAASDRWNGPLGGPMRGWTLSLAFARPPLVGSATSSDGSRRRRSRLHGDPGPNRPGTRASPATSATAPTAGPPSRLDASPPLPPGAGGRAGGIDADAVGDEGVPIRDIAEVIGRISASRWSPSLPRTPAEHFAWLGGFLGWTARLRRADP